MALFAPLVQSGNAKDSSQQAARGRLQRTCECGNKSSDGGTCDRCKLAGKLQRRALAVGPADDLFEREADRVADSVMANRAPPSTPSKVPLDTQSGSHGPPPANGRAGGELAGGALDAVHEVLSSPGQPLDAGTRGSMETRFGADFSSVRIHAGASAGRSARAVGARAYTVGRDIVFGAGEFAPGHPRGRHLLAHELTHTLQQAGPSPRLQREDGDGDPLEGLAELGELADPGTVQAIVLDSGSRRTRFYTTGGKTYDGKLTVLASNFGPGNYVLKRANSKDPKRTWNIFHTDGSVFRGGWEFDVFLEGVDFASLGYTPEVKLTVASGLLPKLIDIEARIKAIKEQVARTLVNDAEERAILAQFEDIPPEQAAEFVKRLREEKVGDMPLLERLDKDVDGENNIALHQHLTRLKLQGGGAKSAKALADAPELAWHDVMGFFEQKAVFSVTPSGKGKYRIRYLGGITGGLYSDPRFAEIKRQSASERLNLMTGGIEVDADQPILVHDYDNDRLVVLTAEDLIAYQHAGVRKFLQDVGTIASLATPVGAETVGARVLAYGVQIASVATLIVDENKLNIRKWFPNWGPAIIDASEKIKLVIAVVGVAQMVQGGWKLFANLRRLRASRAAMDAKAVVSSAEEAALAEKQAAQLEANAEKLLEQADLARKELGVAEELAEAGAKLEGASAAALAPSAKTRIIESAIGKGDFGGEFAGLANRELLDATKNPSKLRPARMSGYSLEVQIEGTEHFLARNAKGGWCLFSGKPKGCGVIGIDKTVDDLFAQIGRELGFSKATRIGNKGRIDLAAAVADAEGIAVDLKVQPHSAASEVRAATGVSGKDVQSAHHAPTSAVKGTPGYSREGALTVLLPRATHKAFDDFWKEWSIAQRKAGQTQVTVERFVEIMDRAIQQTPNLDAKAKGTMSWIVQNEFRELGFSGKDLIDLPYSNIKPGAP
ncbi:eCIS core domain-containing protein [Variovorax sp. JS1663]|uniref:eCIS core domain-containing protein n=1 Tax=Variovorax sp. JS1663 TaxID=1851577 RepID=UPI000B6898BF|nr:DUF4157 domain-containing protein [Variovorax sp. JS1663]OUL98501.1 hypothetical protein A8M77_31335 [Variovorax sp. JS1663]